MKINERAKVEKLENPSFAKGFCMKPGFRYSALRDYCHRIEFITDGFNTDIATIGYQIRESLKDFSPEEDCIVPSGTGIVNLLVGYYLASKFPSSSVAVAFFRREITKHNRITIPEYYEFYRFLPSAVLEFWS